MNYKSRLKYFAKLQTNFALIFTNMFPFLLIGLQISAFSTGF